MGKDLTTVVRINDRPAECRVLLETGTLICRGALKRTFAHGDMKRLSAQDGTLCFTSGTDSIAIELGRHASAWKDAILNPRSRVQKLGIAEGMKVAVLGTPAGEDLDDIEAALGNSPSRRLAAGMDVVLLFAQEKDKLAKLAQIESRLRDRGAVWLLWPKGRKDFAHEDVVAGAKAAGLVQTRSIGFSPVYSGLRLVRPAKPGR